MAYSMFIYPVTVIFLSIISINATSEFMQARDSNNKSFQEGIGVVSPGQSINIDCPHTGQVSWTSLKFDDKETKKVENNNKINVEGNKLKIANIDFSDASIYYCELSGVAYRFYLYVYDITNSKNGTVPTTEVKYEMNGIKFSQLKLTEKSSANISCTCDSGAKKSSVTISWKGQMLSNKVSESYNIITENKESALSSTLVLNKLQNDRRYYGKYTCSCNIITGALKEKVVYIQVPPIFEEHESSIRTTEGQNITLTCEAWGYPNITKPIIWKYQNSTEFRKGIEIKANESTPGYSQLVIPFATQDDRGVYTCHVENSVGSNIAGTMVRVKGRYAALWPFIGIVIQLIILAAIIIVYEWKKSHKTQEDSSKFNYDSKNQQDVVVVTKSTEVTDVRQRLMKD